MRSRVGGLALGCVLLTLSGVLVTRASDLSDRIQILIDAGRYDLARDILVDRVTRGEDLDPQVRWMQAELETDPDEFDRQLHELLQDTSAKDAQSTRWLSARAIEHFAQGRYQTAVDLLNSRSESELLADDRAPVFLGMALQALGQTSEADAAYARIPTDHPAHSAAQVLRAELAMRGGDARAAAQLARAGVEDADYGAQARLVLAQVARAEGKDAEAEDWMRRLRRDFPDAVEGSWAPASTAPAAEVLPSGFREIDAPDPRPDYALQLGAFRDRSLALRFVRQLVQANNPQLEGLRLEVDRVETPPWYRVVAGNYVTRSQAQRVAQVLEDQQIAAIVLDPERGPR